LVDVSNPIAVRRLNVGMSFHEYVRKKISYDEMSRGIAELNKFSESDRENVGKLHVRYCFPIWLECAVEKLRCKYPFFVWKFELCSGDLGLVFGGVRGLIVLEFVKGVISFDEMLRRLFVCRVACHCPEGGYYL
jgi:hypothetical protein